jgi:hypothetical protein
MKAYWGGGIAPRILYLGTWWKWVWSALRRGRFIPTERTAGTHWIRGWMGPGRSGHGGVKKNSQPLPRLEPPIIQPEAQRYTTELSGSLHFTCLE